MEEYFKPIIVMINALAQEVLDEKIRREQSGEKGEVMRELSRITSNARVFIEKGDFYNPSEGRDTGWVRYLLLGTAHKDPEMQRYPESLRTLCALMPTLALLEEGGLERINEELARLLRQLRRKAEESEDHAETAGKINKLLYHALLLFPHLTSGVQVTLQGKPMPGDMFDERYDYRASRGRNVLIDYIARTQRQEPSDQTSMILPLPSSLYTGPVQYRMEALGLNDEAVYLSEIAARGEKLRMVPVVSVMLSRNDVTHLLIDEVLSIKFVNGSPFTPLYHQTRQETSGQEGCFIPRDNHLVRYLRFRQFYPVQQWAKVEKYPFILSQHQHFFFTQVMELEYNSELWQYDSPVFFGREHLKRGFLAIRGELPTDVRLFEFRGLRIWGLDKPVDMVRLYHELCHLGGQAIWKRPVRWLRKLALLRARKVERVATGFSGNAIIERLMMIPVHFQR